jgi:hypothetical protein
VSDPAYYRDQHPRYPVLTRAQILAIDPKIEMGPKSDDPAVEADNLAIAVGWIAILGEPHEKAMLAQFAVAGS